MPSLIDPLNSIHTIYKDIANRKDGNMSKETYSGYRIKNLTVAIMAISSVSLGYAYQKGLLSSENVGNTFEKGNDLINDFINNTFSTNVDLNIMTIGSWVAAVGICAGISATLNAAERRKNIKYFQRKLVDKFQVNIDLEGMSGLTVSEVHKQALLANDILGNHFKLGESQFLAFINKTLQKGRASKNYLAKHLPDRFMRFLNKQNYNLIKLEELKDPDNGQKQLLESWRKSTNYFIYTTYKDYYNNKEESRYKLLNKHIKEIMEGDKISPSDPNEVRIKELKEINEKAIINAYDTLLRQTLQLNFTRGLKLYCEQYLKEVDKKTGKIKIPSKKMKKIIKDLKEFGKLPEMTNRYIKKDGKRVLNYSIKEYEIMKQLFPKDDKPFLNEDKFNSIEKIANESFAKTLQRINPNLSNGGKLYLIMFQDAFIYQRNYIISRGNKNGLNFRDYQKDYEQKEEIEEELTPEKRIHINTFKPIKKDFLKGKKKEDQSNSDVFLKRIEKRKPLHHYNKNYKPKI